MAYIEVNKFVPGSYSFEGPFLGRKVTLTGKIGGKEAEVRVLDGERTAVNNVVCYQDGGAVVFDPESGLLGGNRVLTYLPDSEAALFKHTSEHSKLPFADPELQNRVVVTLSKLYKDGYRQVGIEAPRQTFGSTIKNLPKYALVVFFA